MDTSASSRCLFLFVFAFLFAWPSKTFGSNVGSGHVDVDRSRTLVELQIGRKTKSLLFVDALRFAWGFADGGVCHASVYVSTNH